MVSYVTPTARSRMRAREMKEAFIEFHTYYRDRV